ncbi:MAG: ribonuclease III [Acidimicrobiales bacterium]
MRRAVGREPEPLGQLASRLGWTFSDTGLLVQALSHRSWCAEAGDRPSNERLEFLGDAVLGLVVAEHCYRSYPELSEGSLAKVRAAVVNTAVLAEVGAELGLGDVVMLGRGEDASGGRCKSSILANTTEAVIGAVYLDGGREAASGLVMRLLDSRIAEAAVGPGSEDFKTRLQEVVARQVRELPRYEVVGTGPDHARRYMAQVFVAGEAMGEGSGRSKKDAEQAAARAAWDVVGACEEPATGAHNGTSAGAKSERFASGQAGEGDMADAGICAADTGAIGRGVADEGRVVAASGADAVSSDGEADDA